MIEIDITRKSTLSGVVRTKTLTVDQNKFRAYNRGELLVQEAFPHLSADDREFFITGCTGEEFDSFFLPETEACVRLNLG